MHRVILILFLFMSQTCFAGATQFKSIPETMEYLGDYSGRIGRYEATSESPASINVYPDSFPGEASTIIQGTAHRALIYTIYRTFIHTSASKVTVTVIPEEVNRRSKSRKPLDSYKVTATIDRSSALSLIKQHIGASSFDELVMTQRFGNETIPDLWSKKFNRIYYNDQGKPGITAFMKSLGKFKH